MLDVALYGEHTLARVMCMRMTVHVVPSDLVPVFTQAWLDLRRPGELRLGANLLVQAAICSPESAPARLQSLHQSVLSVLERSGPSTAEEISAQVPELQAKVGYGAGREYLGAFSLGSRLISSMCTLGMLVRARPRGTWQSSLYEYDTLAHWLPSVSLAVLTGPQARVSLVRSYLAAFGPARRSDVEWWAGLSQHARPGQPWPPWRRKQRR